MMRDQIISFTEKRDLQKIFFVIRDVHFSRPIFVIVTLLLRDFRLSTSFKTFFA